MISPCDIGPVSPDVLRYTSLEEFLNDYLQFKKSSNHRITIGSLARAIGFKSRASLHHYLTGQRTPKAEHLKLLLDYFPFSNAQKQHFLNLVELNNIDDLAFESSRLLKNKLRRERPGIKIIDNNILNVANHWLHFAVIEILKTYKKIHSIKELKSLFYFHKENHPLGVIIDDLFSLGYIAHDEDGHLVSKKPKLKTTEAGEDHNIQKYHKEVLNLGKEAIEEIPVTQRYFSSVTFQGDHDKFLRLKAFIKQLEKECLVNKEEPGPKKVYHCNIQLYPIAGIEGETH
ncbi:MAG: hypothetical protein CME70_17040 [Halobacteriovorax sp.]|nr:hypothetical protein [Halobacteriovorax sp.]|tara:strand:- start:124338 stop:125198 length:861 start_codon:yes stop_codon:yes gene_type:complete